MIALPLKDDAGNAFGIISIYSSEVNAFTADEIRLLEELAGDLAFGIAGLRARAERNRAKEALQRSEEKYRTFFEQNPAGNYISNASGKLLDCNSALLGIFGFKSKAEALSV